MWWQDARHDIPKVVTYRLIGYMWTRTSARYDALLDAGVLENAIEPGSWRGLASKTNSLLRKIGIPWQLSCDATARVLTKT